MSLRGPGGVGGRQAGVPGTPPSLPQNDPLVALIMKPAMAVDGPPGGVDCCDCEQWDGHFTLTHNNSPPNPTHTLCPPPDVEEPGQPRDMPLHTSRTAQHSTPLHAAAGRMGDKWGKMRAAFKTFWFVRKNGDSIFPRVPPFSFGDLRGNLSGRPGGRFMGLMKAGGYCAKRPAPGPCLLSGMECVCGGGGGGGGGLVQVCGGRGVFVLRRRGIWPPPPLWGGTASTISPAQHLNKCRLPKAPPAPIPESFWQPHGSPPSKPFL